MFKYIAVLAMSAIALQGCGDPCHNVTSKSDLEDCTKCVLDKMGIPADSNADRELKRQAHRNMDGIVDAMGKCGADKSEVRRNFRNHGFNAAIVRRSLKMLQYVAPLIIGAIALQGCKRGPCHNVHSQEDIMDCGYCIFDKMGWDKHLSDHEAQRLMHRDPEGVISASVKCGADEDEARGGMRANGYLAVLGL